MNKFDIKAKEIERTFFKKIKSGIIFLTGEGKQNNIVSFTDTSIFVKTKRSKDPIRITRKKIRKSIAYMLYRRTATRKDLEQFANYNSALMGLLRLILIGIAKIYRTTKRLLRISIKGVRFFFSGLDKPTREDFEVVANNGGKFILNTYYWLREKGKGLTKWMEKLKQKDIKLLVDSGAFSIFNARMKGKMVVNSDEAAEVIRTFSPKINIIKNITVQEYANFINEYGNLIYGFINLDVIGDPIATQENFLKLKKLTGRLPIPVWHCDIKNWENSNFDLLDKMVQEDYEIIAIGGTVPLGENSKRKLFQKIFELYPNQNFHWLGGTSLLLEFPFFSADSSGYLQGRKNNQIYSYENEKASTKKMPHWTKKKCMEFNVKMLSSLEELYDGIQINLDLVAD